MDAPESMTYAEIKRQFDTEWVLLEDPQTLEGLKIVSGKVLWHSASRDEVYQKALELRPTHSAILFVGELPKGMEVVL